MSNQKPTFKRHKINNGSLSTPIQFYEATKTGPEPNSKELVKVYSCFAETYNPSIKDIEIMTAQGVNNGLTVNIRNTFGEFIPTLDHIVKVYGDFYQYVEYKIVDIAPSKDFIKLILTGVIDGE